MISIAVLVSGSGSNLQALIDAQKSGKLKHGKIVYVISSNKNAYAIERADIAGIDFDVVDYTDYKASGEDPEAKILELLRKYSPKLIVLAGFIKILSKRFIDNCGAKIINIHPSLIPKYCGKGYYGLKVHEAVLANHEEITGATVHYVNEIPDGGQIIMQDRFYIWEKNMTPEKLQQRVLESVEHKLLPKAVEFVSEKMCPNAFPLAVNYPGRGIITGCTPSGRKMFAYFIMGRSQSSKARIFERSGNGLAIKLTKQDPKFDSSLILYSPVRVFGENVIVTNGDQTDTVYDFLSEGKTFEEALRTRTYEPDEPHYTPRISAIMTPSGYKQSILKRAGKFFYEYEYKNGVGHLIHTYERFFPSRDELRNFIGEPRELEVPEDIEKFSESLWLELNEAYKVALYVRYYEPDFVNYQDRLFNINEEK